MLLAAGMYKHEEPQLWKSVYSIDIISISLTAEAYIRNLSLQSTLDLTTSAFRILNVLPGYVHPYSE